MLVNVLQQPDGNAVQIADDVNRELAEIRKGLPPDIELATFYDQSILVRDSIGSVTESILIGLLLSIAVLVGFLKSWRTTLVAALVIPLAILIAIVFMKLFNMSFNLMTLGGIAGLHRRGDRRRHRDGGEHRRAPFARPDSPRGFQERDPRTDPGADRLDPDADHGVRAAGVSLGGITAVFFRALAMTLVTALLASLFLAIFFTPVLAAFSFTEGRRATSKKPKAGRGASCAGSRHAYDAALHWCLAHTRTVLLARL